LYLECSWRFCGRCTYRIGCGNRCVSGDAVAACVVAAQRAWQGSRVIIIAIPQIYFQRSLNMSQAAVTKPAPTEHAPEFSTYITLVAEGDIIQTLEQQIENSLSLLRTIPSDKGNFRYAPDKWSAKELLGHVIDSERIFSYRALRFARNDQTPLPGYEQDD